MKLDKIKIRYIKIKNRCWSIKNIIWHIKKPKNKQDKTNWNKIEIK